MAAMVVDDTRYEVDDELYETFSEIAPPGSEDVSSDQIERLLALCDDDVERAALIRYLMLWCRLTPRQVTPITQKCDRYTRTESIMPVCTAGAKLRGRMPHGTVLTRGR